MDNKQQTLNKIVELLELEHDITINENNKYQIKHLLNQMHGLSHKAGLEEGIKVAKQISDLQKNHT